MAESTLHIGFSGLERRVAMAIGWDRVSSNWSSSQDAIFSQAVRSGLRQFYFPPVTPGFRQPHRWGFLSKEGTIVGQGVFTGVSANTTNTVSATLGVAKFTGNSVTDVPLPNWATYAELAVGSDTYFIEVAYAAESGSQAQLSEAATFSASAYTLTPVYYNLPEDFGGIDPQGFWFGRGEESYGSIPIVDDSRIRAMDNGTIQDEYPTYASIVSARIPYESTATRQRHLVRFWAPLVENRIIRYRYYSTPYSVDGFYYNHHAGGAMHSETVCASIIDKAAQIVMQTTEHHARFLELLAASVEADRRRFPVSSLGHGPYSDGTEYATDDLIAPIHPMREA